MIAGAYLQCDFTLLWFYKPSSAGEWTAGRELKIALGYEAYIIADTRDAGANSTAFCQEFIACITLLDGGVKMEPFAVLSSSGSTPIKAPENPPAVTAVLVAPQVGVFGTGQILRVLTVLE